MTIMLPNYRLHSSTLLVRLRKRSPWKFRTKECVKTVWPLLKCNVSLDNKTLPPSPPPKWPSHLESCLPNKDFEKREPQASLCSTSEGTRLHLSSEFFGETDPVNPNCYIIGYCYVIEFAMRMCCKPPNYYSNWKIAICVILVINSKTDYLTQLRITFNLLQVMGNGSAG